MNQHGPLQPQEFSVGSDMFRPQWRVEIDEQGRLMITAIGRRHGKLLVQPDANNMVTVTTFRIEAASKGGADGCD